MRLFQEKKAARDFIANQVKSIKKLFTSIKLSPNDRFYYMYSFGLYSKDLLNSFVLSCMRQAPHGFFYCTLNDAKKSRGFFNKIVNDRYSSVHPGLTQLALKNKDQFFVLLQDYEMYLLKHKLLLLEHNKYVFPDFFDLIRFIGAGYDNIVFVLNKIRLFRDLYIQHTIIKEQKSYYLVGEEHILLFLKQKMIAFEKVEKIFMLILDMNPELRYGRLVQPLYSSLQSVRNLSCLDKVNFGRNKFKS